MENNCSLQHACQVPAVIQVGIRANCNALARGNTAPGIDRVCVGHMVTKGQMHRAFFNLAGSSKFPAADINI